LATTAAIVGHATKATRIIFATISEALDFVEAS
jgi:hypothetical protein